jgi:hypothetical protein
MVSRSGLDEGRANVLAVRGGRVHPLADLRQQPTLVEADLHLLLGEPLDVVDGEDHPGRAARRQQRLLHAHRVDGVAVDEQHAAGKVVTGQPQRISVVPAARPVVGHQGEGHPVGAFQRRHPGFDRRGGVPDHHHDVGQPDRGQVPQRDVQDRVVTEHWQQCLGKGVGDRHQPPSGARRQYHPDHCRPFPRCVAHPLAPSAQICPQTRL